MQNTLQVRLKLLSIDNGDICLYKVRPYILRYHDLELTGNAAYYSRMLYPQYIGCLAKYIIEDDAASFEYLLNAVLKPILNKIKIDCISLLDYLPDKYENILKKLLCNKIVHNYDNSFTGKGEGILYTGIRISNGKKYLSNEAIIKLQIHTAGIQLMNKVSAQKLESYNEKLSFMEQLLMNSIDDTITKDIPIDIMLADEHGNLNQYIITIGFEVILADNNSIQQKLLAELSGYRKKFMLVSPFSYGKSTIANALAGMDLFNVDYLAETAVITECSYAPINVIYIEYNNNRTEYLRCRSREDLKKALLPYSGKNYKNANNIRKITIYSSDFDIKYLSLIDSPGLFSTYENHDDITIQAIDRLADVVVFVMDPVQIERKQYIEFIQKCNESDQRKFIYIINKLDSYFDHETKFIEAARKVLTQFHINNIEIHTVSGLFGYIAKCINKKYISLEQVQQMKEIFARDEEGYSITGRRLQIEHIPSVLKMSRINELESVFFKLI